MQTIQQSEISAPDVPGLRFRPFRGPADYPAMVAVVEGMRQEDDLDWVSSVEQVTRDYRHLHNCDLATDMVFAEVEGVVVAYGRCWWSKQVDGMRMYMHFAHCLPAWRHHGIRRAIVARSEARLQQIAAGHPHDGRRFFQCWGADSERHWQALLQHFGYEPVRHGYAMCRSLSEPWPEAPLPAGLAVRPVSLDKARQVWEGAREAFRDHWGMSEWPDDAFQEWRESPWYDPGLWQVAWEGDEVAGGVLNYVNEAENREYERRRGYTETIFVRRPWRRRGLARALIARSFGVLRNLGLEEAALGVDTENVSGALHLYESMGFAVERRFTTFRKPLV